MPEDRNASLRQVGIFSNASAGTLQAVEASCHWRSFDKRAEIVSFRDKTNDVYFLGKGRARVVIYSASGKAVGFGEIRTGDIFGELAAIDGQPRSASVEAIERCLIASMPASKFTEVLRNDPVVSFALLCQQNALIRSLTSRVYEFSTLAARNRIQAELLRRAREHMVDDNSARLDPAPTHEEIAAHVSSHREAVTRELSHLSDLGIVRRQGAVLHINDMERLAKMVREASGD